MCVSVCNSINSIRMDSIGKLVHRFLLVSRLFISLIRLRSSEYVPESNTRNLIFWLNAKNINSKLPHPIDNLFYLHYSLRFLVVVVASRIKSTSAIYTSPFAFAVMWVQGIQRRNQPLGTGAGLDAMRDVSRMMSGVFQYSFFLYVNLFGLKLFLPISNYPFV